ncbi:ankyrin 2,3 unc44 [Nesidiocoris tenuis]|uniref:Ankyrin 2,3 unc44 n=2 Tax=Nesidiocoris tenuis TaxID=355587 RepID=A0ABN7BHQ5_9HEMI|nr:ankyrin 2,3 unc44 [Nesidiocoris tenuis]
MAFYRNVQEQYGVEAKDNLKSLATLNKKLMLSKSRRWFLLKCRSKKVYPSHILQNFNCIYNSVSSNSSFVHRTYRIVQRFKHDLLNLEIKITIDTFNSLQRKIDELITWISDHLPPGIVNGFLTNQRRFCGKFFEAKNKVLNDKFRRLCGVQAERAPGRNTSYLVKMVDVEMSVEVEDVLGLSPSVNLPYNANNLPVLDIITDVEMILGDVEDPGQRRAVRANAATILRNGISRYKNQPQSALEPSVRAARSFLHDHPELVLTRSDKGKTSVLMLKEEYHDKMNSLLDDRSVYKIQKTNPTYGLQKRCNDMVDRLVGLGCIDRWKKDTYKTQNAVAPKIYGLPKCHKDGIPLRPIVSCLGSPGLRLSHLVKDLLKPLKSLGSYDVVNSYTFQQEIDGLVLQEDEIMVSFDVVSLFTNVPLEIVIYLVQRHWRAIEEHTNVPLDVFLDLIDLTCMQGYFQYNDDFVRQLSGVAMGGVLSSDVAGMVMIDLINWVIPRLPFCLRMVRRYVDDLFLILPMAHVDDTLAIFNEYHHRLQFTCEREVDNRLPFLDLLLVRGSSGRISTDWYRKPSASDRCLDFRSAHAYAMKLACAKELMGRALRLSSPEYRETNKTRVGDMLRANGYPRSMIGRLMAEWSSSSSSTQDRQSDEVVQNEVVVPDAPPKIFMGLTYVQGISPKLKALLQKDVSNVSVVFKYVNKISRLHTRLKAADPIQLQSGVVYKVNCKDCPVCYIGHTISYLKVRMARHGRDCRNEHEEGTMLSQHAIEMGHVFDFENVKIEDREQKRGRREFKEKLHIMLNENCCNKRTDVNGISSVYAGILADIKAART